VSLTALLLVRRGDDRAYAEPASVDTSGALAPAARTPAETESNPRGDIPDRLCAVHGVWRPVSVEGAADVLGSLVVGVPIGLALAL
jgi:hypothetical protein